MKPDGKDPDTLVDTRVRTRVIWLTRVRPAIRRLGPRSPHPSNRIDEVNNISAAPTAAYHAKSKQPSAKQRHGCRFRNIV